MARANALSVSSFFEGLPLSIVEALCIGLPVVAADCPSGAGEALDHGAYGSLTPVGDVLALADALRKVWEKDLSLPCWRRENPGLKHSRPRRPWGPGKICWRKWARFAGKNKKIVENHFTMPTAFYK